MIVLAPHLLDQHIPSNYGDGDDKEHVIDHQDSGVEGGKLRNSDTVGEFVLKEPLMSLGQRNAREEMIELWQKSRLKVSIWLGSIGAPPLSPPTSANMLFCNDKTYYIHEGPNAAISTGSHEMMNADSNIIERRSLIQTLKHHLDIILHLSTAHAQLIETMNEILEILSIGTGVRLGLGPIAAARTAITGSGRIVSRAEKAWVSRQLRQSKAQTKGNDSNGSSSPWPKLTLQRSRLLLHQGIVYQATSLQELMQIMHVEDDKHDVHIEWSEFIQDLQQSLRSPNNTSVLTLSQLSTWLSHIGSLLSYILSGYLYNQLPMKSSEDETLEIMKQSTQMAIERKAFLSSAFPLQKPKSVEKCEEVVRFPSIDSNTEPTGHIGEKNTQQFTDEQEKIRAKKMIDGMHAVLDTARISLWAFEDSFFLRNENADCACDGDLNHEDQHKPRNNSEDGDDIDSTNPWWSEYKDLISQSWATITQFEGAFLATSDGDTDEDGANSEAGNPTVREDRNLVESSEHVSNVSSGCAAFVAGEPLTHEPPADKILVFSGRGTHKKKREALKKPAKHDIVPPTPLFSVTDQMMLMRDLEKMLKTMGLAEEHEVVAADVHASDANNQVTNTRENRQPLQSPQKHQTTSRPFFLGVSGALLSELSNVIPSNNRSASDRFEIDTSNGGFSDERNE